MMKTRTKISGYLDFWSNLDLYVQLALIKLQLGLSRSNERAFQSFETPDAELGHHRAMMESKVSREVMDQVPLVCYGIYELTQVHGSQRCQGHVWNGDGQPCPEPDSRD